MKKHLFAGKIFLSAGPLWWTIPYRYGDIFWLIITVLKIPTFRVKRSLFQISQKVFRLRLYYLWINK